ncbi:hypothetical protein Tco_0156392 [Tanacetum coccineum]
MSTYLKHMGGYTYKQLKGKSFDEIQKLFDKEINRVNTFVAMGFEVQESKEKKEEGREETTKGSRKKMLRRKRAGKEQQRESSKKQKVEEEKESDTVDEYDEAELKKLLVIKKDEDIAIDAIPLATKLLVRIYQKSQESSQNGQARTRETEEYKAEARKVKPAAKSSHRENKDKKGTENVAADHLSQIDNDETSDDSDVDDNFPGKTLMEITTKDTPWFVDFANYLVDSLAADLMEKNVPVTRVRRI